MKWYYGQGGYANAGWQYPDQYPKSPEELTDVQWRWEFLRRSAEYMDAFERGQPIYEAEPAEIRYPLPEDEKRYRMTILIDPCDDEGWKSIRRRVGEEIFTAKDYKHLVAHAKRFGIENISQQYAFSAIKNRLQIPPLDTEWMAALAAFDLSQPLRPQLLKVEELLTRAQRDYAKVTRSPKLTGSSRRPWPTYLRLLDAVACFAKPMEIFRCFEQEGLEEVRDAANEASKIDGMIEAAYKVQEKVILFL